MDGALLWGLVWWGLFGLVLRFFFKRTIGFQVRRQFSHYIIALNVLNKHSNHFLRVFHTHNLTKELCQNRFIMKFAINIVSFL